VYRFSDTKIAKRACVDRFVIFTEAEATPNKQSPYSSHTHKMSQAPEVASQMPPPDVKPGKDEIAGGNGNGNGSGNEPINVKVRYIIFIYQRRWGHRAESGGLFSFLSFFLHRSRSLRPTVKRYSSRSNAPRSSLSFRAHTRTRSEKTSTASGA